MIAHKPYLKLVRSNVELQQRLLGEEVFGYVVEDAVAAARIIISCTRVVHAPRYGPALQHVVRCGLHEFRAGYTRKPRLELLGLKDHRHAVVQLAHELVCVRDDHCA